MSIDVGLVGFGYAARTIHLPLILSSGMRIAGVVSQQRDLVSRMVPSAILADSLEALLANPSIAVVVIATPNHRHELQALAAIQAGRRVVVDKPMALSVSSADRLIAAAGAIPGMLTPFHNRRWDSDFLTVRRIVAEGTVGTVHTLEARWHRFRPIVRDRWREHASQGGGVLFDLGTHMIDQVLVMFGMPDWLQADVFCQRPGSTVDDAFEIRMAKGKLRIVLAASCLTAGEGPRFRLVGDRGTFTSDNLDSQEDQLQTQMLPTDDAFGVELAGRWGRLIDGESSVVTRVPAERGCWGEFYRSLRQCIEADARSPVSPRDARQVLQVIEAARYSSQHGVRVSLPSE